MPTTELSLDEANELLAAWSTAQAEAHGIRALIIKGRPLADDGLRAPRVSADVDLLIQPAQFDRYCAAVLEAGWEEFPSTFASAHFTLHSRSFRKSGWPNSFDVHSEYPGFLRGPDVAFDALWETRRTCAFAHRDCQVPSRVANAIILALHSLRGAHEHSRHQSELAELATAHWTDAERTGLTDLAVATGSAGPLQVTLAGWGVSVEPDPVLERSPAAREWHRKTAEAQGRTASWVLLLAQTPLRRKFEVLARALWPSRADFTTDHPEIPDRAWPLAKARVARWGRGFRRLPSALAAILWRG